MIERITQRESIWSRSRFWIAVGMLCASTIGGVKAAEVAGYDVVDMVVPGPDCDGETAGSVLDDVIAAEGSLPEGQTSLNQAAREQANPEDLAQCVPTTLAPVEQVVPVTATSIPVGDLLAVGTA